MKKIYLFFKTIAYIMKCIFTPSEVIIHDTYNGNILNKRGKVIGNWPINDTA